MTYLRVPVLMGAMWLSSVTAANCQSYRVPVTKNPAEAAISYLNHIKNGEVIAAAAQDLTTNIDYTERMRNLPSSSGKKVEAECIEQYLHRLVINESDLEVRLAGSPIIAVSEIKDLGVGTINFTNPNVYRRNDVYLTLKYGTPKEKSPLLLQQGFGSASVNGSHLKQSGICVNLVSGDAKEYMVASMRAVPEMDERWEPKPEIVGYAGRTDFAAIRVTSWFDQFIVRAKTMFEIDKIRVPGSK